MATQVLKVNDFMTADVHVCRVQDSLDRAARLLWEHDCGCLPVVDADGIARAMITDRDICMAAYTRGRSLAELCVADAMSSGLVTCGPDDELAATSEKMVEHQVRRLPVVDEAGKVRGLLSVNDLACAVAEGCPSTIGDPAAAESLRVLTAVCRRRGTPPSEAADEVIAPSSPQASRVRSAVTVGKTARVRRARHETAK